MNALTRELGTVGLLHLETLLEAEEQGNESDITIRLKLEALEALKSRCEYLLSELAIVAGTGDADSVEQGSELEVSEKLSSIEQVYGPLREKQDKLDAELQLLLAQVKRLKQFPFSDIPFEKLRALEHLRLWFGMAPISVCEQLERDLLACAVFLRCGEHEQGQRVIIVGARRHEYQIETILKNGQFQPDKLFSELSGSATDELRRIEVELRALEVERLAVVESIEKIRRDTASILQAMARAVEERIAIVHAQESFMKARSLTAIGGWIPMRQEGEFRQVVSNVTRNTALIQYERAPNRARIPVQLADSKLLRPFQFLTKSFGTPRYDELDPSPLMALGFLLMFGFMFGDVGQGAVLSLGGWVCLRSGKRSWENFGLLLIPCGISAMGFGFLYGSVFGAESVLPGLWLRPLHDVRMFGLSALGIGAVFIAASITVGIINSSVQREYVKAVCGRSSVMTLVLYVSVLRQLVSASAPSQYGVIFGMGIPLILIAVHEPLQRFIRRERPLLLGGVGAFIFSAAIELMELSMALLANTVSFVRLAGFALGHAALCLVVYALVEMTSTWPLGAMVSAGVLVLGNVVVIVLEGLVGAIQALRLQSYELMSRYFSGGGVPFQPFQLMPAQAR